MEPLEAAVLLAVSKGVNTVENLALLLNVDKEELGRVVEGLVAKGLLNVQVKGLIFKRKVLTLTRAGYNLLPEASKKVKEIAEKAREVVRKVREQGLSREEAYGLLTPYMPVLPLLVWLGLLPTWLLPFIGLEFLYLYDLAPMWGTVEDVYF